MLMGSQRLSDLLGNFAVDVHGNDDGARFGQGFGSGGANSPASTRHHRHLVLEHHRWHSPRNGNVGIGTPAADCGPLRQRGETRISFRLLSGDSLPCHVQPFRRIAAQQRRRSVPMGLGFRKIEDRA